MYGLTAILLLVLLGTGAPTAQKDLDTLKAEAEKATGGQQAKLYSELADRLVDVADQQFSQGSSVQGHATVQEVLQDANKAHDIALRTHDQRKEVEIHLRLTQRHLENLKRTLAAEDRPALDEVEKKLAELRQELQDSMFAPKKKDVK
ncbi:MAG TPA: hypothetical protein VI488_13460 [Candidatus Angelobacter sp.]